MLSHFTTVRSLHMDLYLDSLSPRFTPSLKVQLSSYVHGVNRIQETHSNGIGVEASHTTL